MLSNRRSGSFIRHGGTAGGDRPSRVLTASLPMGSLAPAKPAIMAPFLAGPDNHIGRSTKTRRLSAYRRSPDDKRRWPHADFDFGGALWLSFFSGQNLSSKLIVDPAHTVRSRWNLRVGNENLLFLPASRESRCSMKSAPESAEPAWPTTQAAAASRTAWARRSGFAHQVRKCLDASFASG